MPPPHAPRSSTTAPASAGIPQAGASAAGGPGSGPANKMATHTGNRWIPLVLPPLASLLVLGGTFLYWQSEESSGRAQREQNFRVASDQIAYDLRERLATYELVLRGLKGYFEGSERIDLSEFQSYVRALQLRETRPGLQGVSLIVHLPAADLAAHTATMRESGFPEYSVRPAGERSHYAPITHIAPLAGDNLRVIGADVMTRPIAREALERARDTGDLALSGEIPLMQDDTAGLVMVLPIYRAQAEAALTGGSADTAAAVAERREQLLAWVSAPFRLADVMVHIAREFDPHIGLEIVDVTAPRLGDGAPAAPAPQGKVLYRGHSPTDDPRASGEGTLLRTTRFLEVGGRRWALEMTPLPAFEERHRDDTHRPVVAVGVVLSLLLGWFTWVLATGRERALALARGMTAELRAARDDLESTLNAIPDLLFEVDLDGTIHHYRSARSHLLAVSPDLFVGRRLSDVVPPSAAAGCLAAIEAAHRTGYSAGHQYMLELGGVPHWFELSIARKERAAPGDGPRFIALSRDITERKEAEARTHQLAYFDGLTGLPNRRMLLDRLGQALHSAQSAAQVGAVLYIDLDNFKQINDARGHPLGDALLLQVADRLGALVSEGDTVARLGGDEFVILLQHLALDVEGAGREALLVAERVRAALEAPYAIDGHLYSSTGSIGVTLFPKRSEDERKEGVEDLLREADTAMYRAKDLGRNRIRFYEAAMQADVQERLALEQDLKKAQAAGQLSAFVQSQVDAAGQVVGGELLMRWVHPVRGNVPPAQFIPIAESSGLILRMGDWMIEQACMSLATLQAEGRPLALSVNVSERQFRQDDFVERVRDVLARTGADPASLVLEITESHLIENLEGTIARMTEIVQMGVRFSIDDFGTGYSSLAYLKRLPLYELKIDKSFVQDTPADPDDTAIVRSIIAVARHLRLRVVAEGVETREQADFLAASHCDCLQGYLFGRPQPLKDWMATVEGAKPAPPSSAGRSSS